MKKYFQIILAVVSILPAALTSSAQTRELGLRDALQMAARGNRQLQIKWLENQRAQEATKEAKSRLLPSVSANASYNIYAERPVIYLRNETASPKLDDIKFGGRFAFDGSVNAVYPIADPVLKSNIRLSHINEKISRHEITNAEEAIALSVSQIYLSILVNKEQKLVLQQSLSRNEKSLQDSRSLFLQGKNLKTDTLSNYISVQNILASISVIENNIEVLSAQLKQLMGMEDSVRLEFKDSLGFDKSFGDTTNYTLSAALDKRADLAIQSLLIDYSKEQLQNVKAGFKPQLTAIARYQVQNQSDHLRFWNYNFPRTSFAGVQLNVPIYSGNRLKHKTTQSALYLQQNEIAQQDLKNKINTELIQLNANLKAAHDQWRIQQQNAEAAQINYNMMNDRYRFGLGSRLELTDAELALTKAKLAQLEAVYSIKLAELQLKKAMGELRLR